MDPEPRRGSAVGRRSGPRWSRPTEGRPPRRPAGPDLGAARHGLRRQRRHRRRRPGPAGSLRQPAAGGRGSRTGAWHSGTAILYGGGDVQAPIAVNEAEGDFAILSTTASWPGTASAPAWRARRAGDADRREVVSLELVDPRYYHLDVALTVLDDRADHSPTTRRPSARPASRCWPSCSPTRSWPTRPTPHAFGLNAVSDGLNVWLPAGATHLRCRDRRRRLPPRRGRPVRAAAGGGSVKCCTQEIRPARPTTPLRREPHDDHPRRAIRTDRAASPAALLAAEDVHVAHNYHPLEVVVATGSGAVVTDVDGVEYLDFLAAYSATNFGHGHPALLAAARAQLGPGHADLASLPPRPARPVRRRRWPDWSARRWCCR